MCYKSMKTNIYKNDKIIETKNVNCTNKKRKKALKSLQILCKK